MTPGSGILRYASFSSLLAAGFFPDGQLVTSATVNDHNKPVIIIEEFLLIINDNILYFIIIGNPNRVPVMYDCS
jgi:hypothetical protein